MTMTTIQPAVRFFLGANTPGGFLGYLNDLYDCKDGWQATLIKSGPGTGKSSLMRRVLEEMTAAGYEAEVICCSSDPHSLDGLVFREQKLCLFDATSPHVMEPKYWGAVDSILPLDSCIDREKLAPYRDEVIAVVDACADAHKRCCGFLGAAANLLHDSARIAGQFTDVDKVLRSARRFSDREFGPPQGRGREWRRFLSAVTPEGIVTFHGTLCALCPRIVSLEDEYGVAAPLFLKEVRDLALEADLELFTCACPVQPQKLEHLLIPSLGLGLTTSNSFHKADFPVYRRIHAARFTDADGLRSKKQILSFNRRAARELVNEAISIAGAAKNIHDTIESYYKQAMDWESVDLMTDAVVDRFLRAAK